jgi:integrase
VLYHLTDTEIKTTKPGLEPVKLTDGGGMFLLVNSTGSKLWRYQYRVKGKRKLMALGAYPDVSLKQAREKHQAARQLLADGTDPMEDRKGTQEAEAVKGNTFEEIFHQWFDWWKVGKDDTHAPRVERRMVADVIPAFGDKAMDDITPGDIRKMMLDIAKRGANDIPRRCHETTSQVFRFAIARGLANQNPTVHFRPSDIVRKPEAENFARVSERELPALLSKMDAYNGTGLTKFAMRLLALTFVRTSDLIEAPWEEFDLDNAKWAIPATRMKNVQGMRADDIHIVPLSRQAVEIMRALKMLSGTYKLVFPGDLDKSQPMSKNTILKALDRMGYKGIMTGHGWRGIASTTLHENGFVEEHIEMQLAHKDRKAVSAAYNYAKYLKQRTQMMQWWADYLDTQRGKA